MATDAFFEHLTELASANHLKDATEATLERRARSKGEALDLLRETVRSASPEDRVYLVFGILECLPAEALKAWSRITGNPVSSKHKAIPRITQAYFSDDIDSLPDDDTEEADDEEDDWVFAEDATFTHDPEAAAKPLRDYQAEAVRALADRAHPRTGTKFLVQIATGGGKTRVVNDWIWHHVRPRGHRVLWVTLNWELLRQAAGDLCRRYEDAADCLGWLGGSVHRPEELAENQRAQLVYSTIHTWRARAAVLRREQFDYVVIDEVHWGEGGELYDDLHRRYSSNATFVCMTATPRSWSVAGYERICHHDFPSLVGRGVLARPQLAAVKQTDIRWNPELSVARGDFSPASLRKLARSRARNRLIIDTYDAEYQRFGKTLVFACDIDHAEELANGFHAAGYSAEALHSKLPIDAQRTILAKFKTQPDQNRSRTDILVNVAMLTHGVDIPDIQTVFLTRPTTSDILFSQMVGRGARITHQKDSFNLVDFVDNLESFGDVLKTAQSFLGAFPGRPQQSERPRPDPQPSAELRRHAYNPAELTFYPGKEGFETLQGLELQPAQTFGIEFELTRTGFNNVVPADWLPCAEALLGAVRAAAPAGCCASKPVTDQIQPQNHLWNVKWDKSCGWEVTSRILMGESGFEEIVDVARAIDESATALGLRVNRDTGTHIHLGWREIHQDVDHLRRLLAVVAAYEPAFYSLLAPSRFDNEYCASLTGQWSILKRLATAPQWEQHNRTNEARYLAVNSRNLYRYGLGTLEIRTHGGTIEGPKILTWLSLWMRILFAIDRGFDIPASAPDPAALPLEHRTV